MHSFAAIAAQHNTNLAVVAPGIAEALFATAIGLVAAIPAVLAYNKISTDLAQFTARLEGFGTEFGAPYSHARARSTPEMAFLLTDPSVPIAPPPPAGGAASCGA
jgi:biopolymer transport protein TolQ